MSKIKTILFDYDGVFIPDEYVGIRQLCPNEKLIEKLEKNYYTKTDCKLFWQELREQFNLNFTDNELISAYNSENKQQLSHEQLMFDHARGLSKNFGIALLSNQIAERSSYLRSNKIFDKFDELFFSSEIGLAKPDPKCFEFVINKLQTSPNEVVFVDDMEENVNVAKKLGFNTIKYKPGIDLESEIKQF